MRRLRALLLLLPALGCSDDATAPAPNAAFAGTYTLQTINSQPLPIPLGSVGGAFFMEQIAGSFTLETNGRYQEVAMVRYWVNDPEDGPIYKDEPAILDGSWTARGSTITVTPDNGGATGTGTVNGNRLTLSFRLSDSLYVYVYTRSESSSSVPTRLRTTTSSITGLRSTTVSSTMPPSASPLVSRIWP